MPAEPGTGPRAEHGADVRWLTIAAAARAFGVTERAVRRRVERGTLESRREATGNRVRTLVRVDIPHGDPHGVENQGTESRAEPSAGQSAAAELAALRERAAVAEAERDAERRRVEELRAAFREHVEDLRARLAREDARREAAEARQAEQDRRLNDLLRQLGDLRDARRPPWPGARMWWRRFWTGEG